MLRLAQKDDGAEQGLGKEDLDEFFPSQDKAVLIMTAHFFVKGITAAVLKDIADYILRSPGQWFFYKQVRRCAEESHALRAELVGGCPSSSDYAYQSSTSWM